MSRKKKSKSKSKKSKATARTRTALRRTFRAKPGKKSARKKAKTKAAAKKKAPSRPRVRKSRASAVSAEREFQQDLRGRSLTKSRATPGRRMEDFEGLSTVEGADSESVDELVEEGNVFEAGAVAGVEEADTQDERDVHTREVPEDDVPEEYLDED